MKPKKTDLLITGYIFIIIGFLFNEVFFSLMFKEGFDLQDRQFLRSFNVISIISGIIILFSTNKNESNKFYFNVKGLCKKLVSKNIYVLSLLYFILICLGIYFSDKGWFEEDALYQIDGIVNLVRWGPTNVYRYSWQPFAYEFSSFLYSVFKSVNVLYILPTLFGSIGICLLSFTLHLYSQKRVNLFYSLFLLLLFPELFFTLLYYNSTAFALCFFSIALFLTYVKPNNKKGTHWDIINGTFAGISLAVACLFRFDFFFKNFF